MFRKSAHKIFLTRGRSGDRQTWHYVKVETIKQSIFLHALGQQSIDLKDYGEVLFSGWGEHPPEDVKRYVAKKYAA